MKTQFPLKIELESVNCISFKCLIWKFWILVPHNKPRGGSEVTIRLQVTMQVKGRTTSLGWMWIRTLKINSWIFEKKSVFLCSDIDGFSTTVERIFSKSLHIDQQQLDDDQKKEDQ